VSEQKFSNRILKRFAETAALELGADQFNGMLAMSNLPLKWRKPETFLKVSVTDSVHVYAALQSVMRIYYGRGARGVLIRMGQRMWNILLEDTALVAKTQAAVIKRLPLATRRKPTLELLGRLIGSQSGDITIHTLDLDLLLADHASPSTHDQSSPIPICYVTQGLIRESLFWATGQNHDVEETSCKAMGKDACEFRIITGK
jgi:predicted hydrocarbon binding protein